MAQDESRSALYQSLKALCQGEGVHKPNLQRRLGEQLRSCWRIEPSDSDEQVLAIVTHQVKRLIKSLHDEQLEKVAEVDFNVAPTGHEHMKVMNRREWLADNNRQLGEVRTLRRKMDMIILPKFESWLRDENFLLSRDGVLAAISPPHPTTNSSIVATASESRYIRRADLEAKLADVIKSGARVILLFGDAGTGKSTLARRLGQDLAKTVSKRSVEIDVKSEGSLIDDIVRVLDRQQLAIPERDVLVKERFKELLASPQAPGMVLLDNAENWRVVEELIPETPQTIILITSRNKLHTCQAARAILVGEMTTDEAVAMIRSRLGSVNDNDSQALAKALSNRPLAIEHACGFLSQEAMSIKDFCLLHTFRTFSSVTP